MFFVYFDKLYVVKGNLESNAQVLCSTHPFSSNKICFNATYCRSIKMYKIVNNVKIYKSLILYMIRQQSKDLKHLIPGKWVT